MPIDIPSKSSVLSFLSTNDLDKFVPARANEQAVYVMQRAVRGVKSTITDVDTLDSLFSSIPGWSIKPCPVAVMVTGNKLPDKIKDLIKPFPEVHVDFDGRHFTARGKDGVMRLRFVHKALKNMIHPHTRIGKDAAIGDLYGAVTEIKVSQPRIAGGMLGEFGSRLYDIVEGRYATIGKESKRASIVPDVKGRVAPSLVAWAMEKGLRDIAKTYLTNHGIPLKPQTKTMRSLKGTGTCPVCFRNVKLSKGKIMRHGWSVRGDRKKRSFGSSWHTGNCQGTYNEPWEVSPKGTETYIVYLANTQQARERALSDLETNPPETIRAVNKDWHRGDGWYEKILEKRKEAVRRDVAALKTEQKDLSKLVADWKPQTLP